MNTAVAERKAPSEATIFHGQMMDREAQFKAALPAHIPVERFMRVILTAIQNNPALLQVSRKSLFNAAVKAAQDGLLPDSREGAIVPYKDEAQWLPMIAGLRKKVRNSGEIATWEAQVVYENDEFEFELGDRPFIKHRPALTGRGKIIAAYSVATLKSGEISREVMTIAEIEGVRTKSRGKNTPWADPIFYPEMCRKTVARRHSKVLPMSTDLDDLMRRDDDLYDMAGARDEARQEGKRPTLGAMLDHLAEQPSATIEGDAGAVSQATQEPRNDAAAASEGGEQVSSVGSSPSNGIEKPFPGDLPFKDEGAAADLQKLDPIAVARHRGRDAVDQNLTTRALPGEYRDEARKAEADAWKAGHAERSREIKE